MILVKENFKCELKVCHVDGSKRFIILRGHADARPSICLCIYRCQLNGVKPVMRGFIFLKKK